MRMTSALRFVAWDLDLLARAIHGRSSLTAGSTAWPTVPEPLLSARQPILVGHWELGPGGLRMCWTSDTSDPVQPPP